MESLPNMVVKYAPTDDPTDATKVDAVSGIYTIPTIFEPMTITVEGVKVSEFDITLPTGAGYTITPYNNQPTRVIYGTNFSFIIGLDEAYNESIPLVKSNGIVISRSAGVYTIEYVTTHTQLLLSQVQVINMILLQLKKW